MGKTHKSSKNLFLERHEEIQKAVATLQDKCPSVTINVDALLDEVTDLQEFLKWVLLEELKRWSTVGRELHPTH